MGYLYNYTNFEGLTDCLSLSVKFVLLVRTMIPMFSSRCEWRTMDSSFVSRPMVGGSPSTGMNFAARVLQARDIRCSLLWDVCRSQSNAESTSFTIADLEKSCTDIGGLISERHGFLRWCRSFRDLSFKRRHRPLQCIGILRSCTACRDIAHITPMNGKFCVSQFPNALCHNNMAAFVARILGHQ